MPKLIQDEFTALKVSPARRYQMRHERDGLCRVCTAPATHGPYCEPHGKAQRALVERYARTEKDPQSVV